MAECSVGVEKLILLAQRGRGILKGPKSNMCRHYRSNSSPFFSQMVIIVAHPFGTLLDVSSQYRRCCMNLLCRDWGYCIAHRKLIVEIDINTFPMCGLNTCCRLILIWYMWSVLSGCGKVKKYILCSSYQKIFILTNVIGWFQLDCCYNYYRSVVSSKNIFHTGDFRRC